MRDRWVAIGKMRKQKKIPPLPVEGWPRPYVRDGVPALSMEKQEEMLEALGLDLSDQKAYRDNLSRPKIRKRAPLVERDPCYSSSPSRRDNLRREPPGARLG